MKTPDPTAREIANRIQHAIDPDSIVLFGSRARQQNRPTSDYDILVIKQSSEPRYRRAAPLYRLLADLPVEVDLVVYTPAEIDEWSNVPQALPTHALREGTVLYEKQN